MNELRAPRRASSVPGARRRSVQGRLSITFGDDGDANASIRSPSEGRGDGDGFRRPPRRAAPKPKGEKARRPAPPVFHPLAYRGVVAGWTIEDRERWGRRANALEETGLSWRDAEAQAFVEVWHDLSRRAASPTEPASEPAVGM